MFHYLNEDQVLVDIIDKDYEQEPIQRYEPNQVNYPINTDLPFYTPTELIDNGILDKINENIKLSDDVSLKDWFINYWQQCNGVSTSDTKNITLTWINKINQLSAELKTSTDSEEIESKKKELYDLGWNPEVDFTMDNRIKARDRVTSIVRGNACDIIDLSQDIDDNINLNEESNDKPIKPVYIVLVKNKGIVGKAIRVVTKAEYSHACLSLDSTLNKLYSFNIAGVNRIQGGFAIENLKKFEDAKISVFCMFVTNAVFEKIKTNIEWFEQRAEETKYNIANIFAILFNKAIKLDMDLVCSTFVDKILKISGIDITSKDSSLVTPIDLYYGAKKTRRKNRIYKIFENLISKYNIKKINKKIQKLMSKQVFIEGGIICEVKEFPVEFDKEGNLLIHKRSRINFDEEFNKSHRLLMTYEKTKNMNGLKYELSKLYFLNNLIENKLAKKYSKELVDCRARILNDFNKYLTFVINLDNNFNFIEYYNKSPFSDSKIKVSASTLKWTIETIKDILKLT